MIDFFGIQIGNNTNKNVIKETEYKEYKIKKEDLTNLLKLKGKIYQISYATDISTLIIKTKEEI